MQVRSRLWDYSILHYPCYHFFHNPPRLQLINNNMSSRDRSIWFGDGPLMDLITVGLEMETGGKSAPLRRWSSLITGTPIDSYLLEINDTRPGPLLLGSHCRSQVLMRTTTPCLVWCLTTVRICCFCAVCFLIRKPWSYSLLDWIGSDYWLHYVRLDWTRLN